MRWKWKHNREQNNNANNNGTIQINTSTDILYKIGKDIGDIKSGNAEIMLRLDNHEKRLKKLENNKK